MSASVALPVAIALPFATTAGVLLCGRRPNARETVSLVAGVALAAVLISLWPVAEDGGRIELWTWLPGITLALELEPLGLLFATVAGVLWPVTTVFSIGYMRGNDEGNQTRFYAFFALAIAAAQLIALSGDLVTLFVGYEVLTLSTWPLVAHAGSPAARAGARRYLVLLLATSIGLLLPAIVWTAWLAGTTEFVAGGLLTEETATAVLTALFILYLFGIGKAALMPFHSWLPSAMVAPTPVSALLHAVAVVKAGVFAVLKVTVYVFGLDRLNPSGVTTPMMWVAAITMLTAAAIALTRDDLKARLAYSTISQLAYIVLAATLATRTAIAGGALHMVTHAAGKITLFFCAGVVYTVTHRTRVSELDGLGRTMPWTFGAFFIASLSIVGLPPMAGTWSKWLLLLGAADAGQQVVMAAMAVGSLLSLAYLLPISARAFFRAPVGTPNAAGDGPIALVLPPVLAATGCIALFFAVEPVIALLRTTLEVTP